MLKKLSTIPFSGTAEQKEKLDAVIAKYAGDKSRLMAVMQEAQEIYGYLPVDVILVVFVKLIIGVLFFLVLLSL